MIIPDFKKAYKRFQEVRRLRELEGISKREQRAWERVEEEFRHNLKLSKFARKLASKRKAGAS